VTARHSTSQHATVLNGSDLLSPSTRMPLDTHAPRHAPLPTGSGFRREGDQGQSDARPGGAVEGGRLNGWSTSGASRE
jgi:hypothetical protein